MSTKASIERVQETELGNILSSTSVEVSEKPVENSDTTKQEVRGKLSLVTPKGFDMEILVQPGTDSSGVGLSLVVSGKEETRALLKALRRSILDLEKLVQGA